METQGKGVAPSLLEANEKGAIGSPSTLVAKFVFFIYILKKMNKLFFPFM